MDENITRQMDQLREESEGLRYRLDVMRPVRMKYDAGMNEVPVYTARQQKRRAEMTRRLEEIAEAQRALSRL